VKGPEPRRPTLAIHEPLHALRQGIQQETAFTSYPKARLRGIGEGSSRRTEAGERRTAGQRSEAGGQRSALMGKVVRCFGASVFRSNQGGRGRDRRTEDRDGGQNWASASGAVNQSSRAWSRSQSPPRLMQGVGGLWSHANDRGFWRKQPVRE